MSGGKVLDREKRKHEGDENKVSRYLEADNGDKHQGTGTRYLPISILPYERYVMGVEWWSMDIR